VPVTSRVVITPLNDLVLASLNAAGRGKARAVQAVHDVVLAGFPNSLCGMFAMKAATADPGNPHDYDLASSAGTPKPSPKELAGWTNPAAANARFVRLMDDAVKTVRGRELKDDLGQVRDVVAKQGLGVFQKMGLENQGRANPVSAVSDLMNVAAGQTTDSRVKADLNQAARLLNWMSLREGGYIPVQAATQAGMPEPKSEHTPRRAG
jgi:hypothetical protein